MVRSAVKAAVAIWVAIAKAVFFVIVSVGSPGVCGGGGAGSGASPEGTASIGVESKGGGSLSRRRDLIMSAPNAIDSSARAPAPRRRDRLRGGITIQPSAVPGPVVKRAWGRPQGSGRGRP